MKKIIVTTSALAIAALFAFGAPAMAAENGSAPMNDTVKAAEPAAKPVKKSVKKHSTKKVSKKKATESAPKSE